MRLYLPIYVFVEHTKLTPEISKTWKRKVRFEENWMFYTKAGVLHERVPFKQEEEEKEIASKRSRARPVNPVNLEALQKYGLEA